ncbi:MAG: dienelactone hydrolase family protein [Verrucomicrobiota bacterium]|nr:dienelactone hydrolase family protein [Verrucomicrobiota bacterium]
MTLRETEAVDLPTPTGPMRTHVFRPQEERRFPGVLFFSEIFQVTGPIRRFAALIASHGYVVAVPEIYHEFEPPGSALPYDESGVDRGNALKKEKELHAFDGDSRAVVDYLEAHDACTGRIGAVGICIGGHLSFRAAAKHREILAAACFYGTDLHTGSLSKSGDDTLALVGSVTGELLMVWGRQDPHIPPEGRQKIHDALARSAVNFTWHEFNAAHAFLRDEGPRYDAALAGNCHALLLELFHRRLR